MKKYALFVLLPSACIVALINTIVPNPSKDNTREYIYKAYASENYETVEIEYAKLLRDDFYNLRYHRGYIFAHYQVPKRAGSNNPRDDYEILAYYTNLSNSTDPNISDIAYYCLGLINTEEHKHEVALDFFGKVSNRTLKYLNNSMGYCYIELGDYESAKASFKREIKADGNVKSAVNNYARVLLRQKDIKGFESILNNTEYKDLIRPYLKKRFAYVSRSFISYVLLIASSYKDNIILEGLISAVLICIVWLLFIKGLDIFEPEKFRFLILTLFMSVVLCELSCHLLYDFFSYDLHFRLEGSLLSELLYCIFGIGLIEESVKLVPVFIILLFTRQINESTDFIVYASISALGFAFQENLGYFDKFGLSSIGGRALTCTLLHMALSSFAIYGLVLSKYKKKPAYYFAMTFLVACIIHGLYDLPLVTDSWLSDLSILSFFIFVFSIIAYKTVFINALNNSEFFEKTDYASTIRKNGLTLLYGLSYIIVVQYSIISVKFGPEFANRRMALGVFSTWIIIVIIYSGFSRMALERKAWFPLFARKRVKEQRKMHRKAAAILEKHPDLDFDALQKEYGKWYSGVGFIILFFTFLLTGIYTLVSAWLASVLHSDASCVHLMLPAIPIWFLHFFALGIITSVIPIHFVFKYLLGRDRYRKFDIYMKLKDGPDGKKVFIPLAGVIIVATCVALPLCCDYYVKMSADQIIVDDYWGFAQSRYSFDDVDELRIVKSQKRDKGPVTRKKYHEIHFADGRVLSFADDNYNVSWKRQAEIMEFISEKSGREIKLYDPYPKIPR